MAIDTGCLHGAVGQRRETVAVLASISTTSLMSVRFAYHLAVARGYAVLRFPAQRKIGDQGSRARIDYGRGVRIAVQGEHPVRSAVVDNRIGVLRRRNPAERLVSLQVEHHH